MGKYVFKNPISVILGKKNSLKNLRGLMVLRIQFSLKNRRQAGSLKKFHKNFSKRGTWKNIYFHIKRFLQNHVNWRSLENKHFYMNRRQSGFQKKFNKNSTIRGTWKNISFKRSKFKKKSLKKIPLKDQMERRSLKKKYSSKNLR